MAGERPRFVSRGGDKLEAAFRRFDLGVAGFRALDVGASTGGFTDCLLQRAARSVVALDAGHGQLHESLRSDPRVVPVERTDVRRADPRSLGAPFPFVVADMSFTSLLDAAEPLLALASPFAELVLLVKPQYEVDRREADRSGGVVAGAGLWRRCLQGVLGGYLERGACLRGLMVSPLKGAQGNVEFLAWLQTAPGAGAVESNRATELDSRPELGRMIDEAVRAAIAAGPAAAGAGAGSSPSPDPTA